MSQVRVAAFVLRRSWPARVGLAIVITFVLTAVIGPSLVGDPTTQDLSQRLLPPKWMDGGVSGAPLGTDQLGRDLLARVVHGSRISLTVALLAVVIAGIIGAAVGLVAGYLGGWLDQTVSRLIDVQASIPFIVLVILMVAILGPSTSNLIVILGVSGWVLYARVVRSEVLSIRELDFVQAARATGVPQSAIMVRHVLPNVRSSIVVVASFATAQMIIMEAALSFLGLGVQPPEPSWGSMLADSRDYLNIHATLAMVPGIAIMVTVLGINLFGDFLRDVFDPRLDL